MEKKIKVVVLGAIRNGKGEILISQRTDVNIPEAHLKWDFVGGSHEFGEDPKETIIREAKEETGLSVKVLDLLPETVSRVWQHKDYLVNAVLLCYRCEVIGGELKLGDPKIAQLKWIAMKDLRHYDLLPTLEPFIKLLERV